MSYMSVGQTMIEVQGPGVLEFLNELDLGPLNPDYLSQNSYSRPAPALVQSPHESDENRFA